MMSRDRSYDVSVVVPFNDDEEVIGTALKTLVAHLQAQSLTFEILAVDEDSGDNSHSVLDLLRAAHPELRLALRILQAPGRGRARGYEYGARHARGRILWMIEPRTALQSLAAFDWVYQQVLRGERDVVVEASFAVAHRTRSWPALDGIRGSGDRFHRRLVRRARTRRLAVEPRAQRAGGRIRAPLGRLLSALSF